MSKRIEIVRGDSATFRVEMTAADCVTPFSLEDFVVVVTVKRSQGDSDNAALFKGDSDSGAAVIQTPPEGGVVDIILPPSVTRLMRGGRLYYFSIRVDGAADSAYTPVRGTIFPLDAANE